MTNKVSDKRHKATAAEDDVEALYHELLHWFYEKEDRERAQEVGARLEAALSRRPDVAASIRGEEIRSLLAELRGDLAEAARSRESEIRKILELHSLAANTPGWEYVLRQYDFRDVSDRLDLLAILYAEQGDLDRAIDTLQESKRFCEAHQVPFDGQDLLTEYEQARKEAPERGRETTLPSAAIDEAICAAYRHFQVSTDAILVDDEIGRRFADNVNHRLPGGVQVSIRDIKRLLLTLRKKSELSRRQR
jgi:tetratricopeptide (TPR) repeat protein